VASVVTLYYRVHEATHERVSRMATKLGCGPAELLRDGSLVCVQIEEYGWATAVQISGSPMDINRRRDDRESYVREELGTLVDRPACDSRAFTSGKWMPVDVSAGQLRVP
jgi:hypothetical protein